MRQVTSHIQIGNYEFDFVTQVEIVASWKQSSKATITLPRNIKWRGDDLRDLINRGDEVVINLGYDYDLKEEFRGYISEIHATTPFKISCEDSMWLLKQSQVNQSWRNVSLKSLLVDIVPEGITIDAVDFQLGPFRASKQSPRKILQRIKEAYGFATYFRGNTLIVGLSLSFSGR